MSEPPRKSGRLAELLARIGGTDEVAPVNRHLFARKVGEIIARGRANLEKHLIGRSKVRGKAKNKGPPRG